MHSIKTFHQKWQLNVSTSPGSLANLKDCRGGKDRAYKHYMKSKSPHDYSRYKDLKNAVHVRCKLRYHEYVNSIVMDENHKPKRLWSFIKSKRTDACGVAPLKRDGIAYSDAKIKADILNHSDIIVWIVNFFEVCRGLEVKHLPKAVIACI